MFEYYFKYRGVHFHDISAESGKQDFETWPCWEVRETSGDKLVGTL